MNTDVFTTTYSFKITKYPAATSAAKTAFYNYRRLSIKTYYSGLFRRSF